MSAGDVRVRGLAETLLSVARTGDMDALAPLVTRMVGANGPQRHLFEPVLLELVAMIVRILRRRSEYADNEGDLYAVELLDADDRDVGIDQLQPALRATLRAVLATLNADADDARFHVSLVSSDPDPLARLDAVAHALRWANTLDDARG
ncbi:hypothetical protein [Prauserella muralis]|uniref:Uncharacterized protein n=1 Tax=Prauserella muralis TaxID=588067 RepID=A0A2V4AZW2_9PSEU|nr:hypothetical protein [Prauserella muralis]PXY27571.1 hypothetical protein BAY60_14255 [Prauserella muralis]TWE22705.1 hypothetical protein FHX69_3956 [Prauserella muralis]